MNKNLDNENDIIKNVELVFENLLKIICHENQLIKD